VAFTFVFLKSSPEKAGLRKPRAKRRTRTEETVDQQQQVESTTDGTMSSQEASLLVPTPATPATEEQQELQVLHPTDTSNAANNAAHEQHEPAHPMDSLGTLQALKYIFLSPRFWALTIGQMAITVIFELNTFFPLYLSIAKKLTEPGEAAVASTWWLLGAALSVLFGGMIYDKLQQLKFGRLIYITVGMVLATGCALVIWLLPALPLQLLFVVIFIFGFCAAPAFYMPMSVFSTKFGGRVHCGKLSSIIDSFAYGSAMVFDNVGGKIAESIGWSVFFLMIVVACGIGLVCQAIFQILDMWNRDCIMPPLDSAIKPVEQDV